MTEFKISLSKIKQQFKFNITSFSDPGLLVPFGWINPKKCSKRFPRILSENTGHDGYPLYRRRKPVDGGGSATIEVRGQEMVLDCSDNQKTIE